MTECIQARRTERCQGSAVTGEGTPLKMPPCPSGLQCCSALVVSVLRSCHVIRYRWSGQGGSLSGMWMGCQTSCSSNKGCHSNDHSVSLTSEPYCYKKERVGLAGMVGRTVGSNAQYLHQLDRQDGGAHQSPLGLLWLGGGRREGHWGPYRGPADTSQDCPWSRPVTLMRIQSKRLLQMYSMFVSVCVWVLQTAMSASSPSLCTTKYNKTAHFSGRMVFTSQNF